MLEQRGQQRGVVVGPVASGGEKDGEAVGIQAEALDAEFAALRNAEYFQMGARPHEIAAHAGLFHGDAALDGVVACRRGAGNVEIDTRLDPVARVAPTTGKFAAIGGATHLCLTERLSCELKISAVQTV